MHIQLTFLVALMAFMMTPSARCESFQQKAETPALNEIKMLADQFASPLFAGEKPLRGLVVGIVHGKQKEVFGYGKAGAQKAIPDGETLFEIASATKPLTALLLAQLSADGKLAYDDVAIRFKDKPVTYRQLVTHTSGLPLLPGNRHNGKYTTEDFRQFLADHSLQREPGSQYEYSTTGFSVLGMCLAQKCGTNTFETCLTKIILAPLGMASTAFELSKKDESRFAGEVLPQPRTSGQNISSASGGLISSANDLLRFVSANLQPESHPGMAKAISQTHEIAAPEIKTFPPCIAAFGWHVLQPARFYLHSGVGSGFRTFLAFDPKNNVGIVMLTNTDMQPGDTRIEVAGLSLLGALANTKLGVD